MTIKGDLKTDLEKKHIYLNTTTNHFEPKDSIDKCSTSGVLSTINVYRDAFVKNIATKTGKSEADVAKEEGQKAVLDLPNDSLYSADGKEFKTHKNSVDDKASEAQGHIQIDDKKLRGKALRQLLNYVKNFKSHQQFFYKLFRKLDY